MHLRRVGAVAEEEVDAGDEPHGGLNPVALPVVDAGLIHPDLLSGLLLEEAEIETFGSNVVAVGSEGWGICLRLRFFGR